MAYRFIKDIWAALRQQANNDIWDIMDAGAPTSGTSGTGVDFCGPGSTYVNITTGDKYLNTGTKASPTWSIMAAGSFDAAFGIFAAGTGSSGATTATSLTVSGVLTTDTVQATWKTAPQTITDIIASATTGAISISFATTVGTAGIIQYAVVRAN